MITQPEDDADGTAPPVDAHHLEQVVLGTQLVGGLIAASLASLEPPLTMPQWRTLVLASGGDANVTAVADDLQVHMSNATRTCDRLVEMGLISRRRADHDRRHVILELTPAGHRLHDAAMAFRRERLRQAMALLSPEDREELARVTALLVAAASRAAPQPQRGVPPADTSPVS